MPFEMTYLQVNIFHPHLINGETEVQYDKSPLSCHRACDEVRPQNQATTVLFHYPMWHYFAVPLFTWPALFSITNKNSHFPIGENGKWMNHYRKPTYTSGFFLFFASIMCSVVYRCQSYNYKNIQVMKIKFWEEWSQACLVCLPLSFETEEKFVLRRVLCITSKMLLQINT